MHIHAFELEDDDAGAEQQEQEPRSNNKALELTFFDDCCNVIAKEWLIKNVIARNERSSWFGPPKGLKSRLLTDLTVHVAAPGIMEWRGYRIKCHGGVVYFAFERAPLTRRRLRAYAQRDGYTGLPIAVCGKIIDLLSPGCVEIIVATVRVAEARWGIPAVLLVIDTINKGIAHGGGDEDKAKDQNRVAANLTLVQELLPGVHIAGIGHTGKDESRGERGSNARRADIDLGVQITGDKIKTATVVDANDQNQGPLTAFATEDVITGVDDDGDDMNAAILSAKMFECEAAAPKEAKLTKNQQTMFEMLRAAGSAGLTSDEWNALARAEGIGTSRRVDLYDIRTALKNRHKMIHEYAGRWYVNHNS